MVFIPCWLDRDLLLVNAVYTYIEYIPLLSVVIMQNSYLYMYRSVHLICTDLRKVNSIL